MSDLDFYKQFQQQSNQAYGDLTKNYATVPIPPSNQTVEDLMASGATSTPTPTPVFSTVQESPVEKYSGVAPVGQVPDGYAPAKCCGTCEYHCGLSDYCMKYDFPCHSSYVCSGYESLEADHDEEEMFSEGCLMIELATLAEEEIEVLADGWTSKGNVKGETRKMKAVLSEGRFPIFDKKSAVAAIKLRGKAKTSKERAKIVRAASRYAPEEAQKAQESDKQTMSAVYTEDRVPTKPALFALAYDSMDATDGDIDSVYGIYAELFENCYGTKEGLYLKEETRKSVVEEAPVEPLEETPQTLSEFEANITVPSTAGEVMSINKDPLYQVAENRVYLIAKSEGKTVVDQSAVREEYSRLLKLRSPN